MKNQEIVLQAEKRELKSGGLLKAMRLKGRIPAVAYGDKEPAVALSIDEKSLQSAIHSERGRNALITLKVADTSHPVLVKEIQRNPITHTILHVDFQRVSLKKKIETAVPIHVKGEAPGVKLGGGVLEHVQREARVRCLPTEIPSSIDLDVSSLQINQGVKAKELVIPQGVELLLDPESIIVNIVAPTILEEPVAAAAAAPGAATTEPEVIKKGKVEEGEEGAAPAAGAKAPAAGAKAPAAGDKKPAAAAPAPAAKPEAKK